MSPDSRGLVGAVPASVGRFVAHWLVLSVGALPLTFVVATLDLGYPWVVGGATLGGTAVAVDRDVALPVTGGFSVVALAGFFVVQAAGGGVLGDPSTAWTVAAAVSGYVAAGIAVLASPVDRLRAVVDPERRGRSRD